MPDLAILRKQALTHLRSALLEVRKHFCTGCQDAANCKCKFSVMLEAGARLLEDKTYADTHGGSEIHEAES